MNVPSVAAPRAGVFFGWGIMVTHGFGLGLIPALLPNIAHSLGSGYRIMGLATSTILFAYGLGAALTPRLAERVGARNLLIATYLLTGAGFVLTAVSGSAPALALCVVALGLSAPVNWTATLQAAGRVTAPGQRGLVMSIASAGGGIGAAANGFFVWFLTGPHAWRWAFVFAAAAAGAAALAAPLLIKDPLPPASSPERRRGAHRRVWAAGAGRMVILVSVGSGVTAFTVGYYLTAVAADEFGTGPLASASLWWLAGAVALAVAPPLGRMADRTTPTRALLLITSLYTAVLLAAANFWSYPVWLLAAAGFAVFNYPIWGLLGLEADRSLPPELAVRAVTDGLALAAPSAGAAIALAGAWFERTSTLRPLISILAMGAMAVAFWLAVRHRAAAVPAGPAGPEKGG